MNVFEAIRKRRSVRGFLDKSIEDEKLSAVLEAGRLAPSAKNRQEWRFVVVKNREVRREVAEAANGQNFVGEAPVVIVACGVTDGYVMSCGQPSYPIDVAIALDHISLAAVEVGLGTCWIGAFKEEEVRKILSVPEDVKIVALTPVGYAATDKKIRPRKDLEDIVFNEEWGKTKG